MISAPFRFRSVKLGLAARFSLFVCGLLLLIALVFIFLLLEVYKSAVSQRASQLVQFEARYYSVQLDQAAESNDHAHAQAILSGLEPRPAVVMVRLFDASGKTMLAELGDKRWIGDRRFVDASIMTGRPYYRMSDRTAAAIEPIKRAGRTIGFADVRMDRRLMPKIEARIFIQMAVLLSSIFLIAIPLTVVMVRRLTMPLRALTEFAGRASMQHVNERAQVISGDEFEKLAEAFNALLGRFDESMRRINRLAYTDTDSGLPNRERFRRELAKEGASQPGNSAVIVVRLHRLGHLQEAVGREAGDELFKLIAKRLRVYLRTIDAAVHTDVTTRQAALLARLGVTEFGILTPRFNATEAATGYAHMLSDMMAQSVEWRGQKLTLNAAIGVALAPQDGDTPDDLLRNAFLAATAANSHHDRLRHFTRSMDREATAEIEFERAMREAIDGREIQAYFQPKVDLATGAIIGAEALARWIRVDRSMISPGRFIPAAERNGMISEIAELMLRESCWNTAAWRRRGINIRMAVNVSPVQFVDERFPDRILRVLEQSGLDPSALELEITESVAMESPERATRLIAPLRERGVRIALDDFGCGHSSLAALTQLPFDSIKIDQQFVRGLSRDVNSATIIETILAMAASLGFDVVAEGIETEQEAEFLRRRGCKIGQGFLFGAALPAAELQHRIETGNDPALRLAG